MRVLLLIAGLTALGVWALDAIRPPVVEPHASTDVGAERLTGPQLIGIASPEPHESMSPSIVQAASKVEAPAKPAAAHTPRAKQGPAKPTCFWRSYRLPAPPSGRTWRALTYPQDVAAQRYQIDLRRGQPNRRWPGPVSAPDAVAKIVRARAPTNAWTSTRLGAKLVARDDLALAAFATAAMHDQVRRVLDRLIWLEDLAFDAEQIADMQAHGTSVEQSWARHVIAQLTRHELRAVARASDLAFDAVVRRNSLPDDIGLIDPVRVSVRVLEVPHDFQEAVHSVCSSIGGDLSEPGPHEYLDDIAIEVIDRCLAKNHPSIEVLHEESLSLRYGESRNLFLPASGKRNARGLQLGTQIVVGGVSVSPDRRYVSLRAHLRTARMVGSRVVLIGSMPTRLRMPDRGTLQIHPEKVPIWNAPPAEGRMIVVQLQPEISIADWPPPRPPREPQPASWIPVRAR